MCASCARRGLAGAIEQELACITRPIGGLQRDAGPILHVTREEVPRTAVQDMQQPY